MPYSCRLIPVNGTAGQPIGLRNQSTVIIDPEGIVINAGSNQPAQLKLRADVNRRCVIVSLLGAYPSIVAGRVLTRKHSLEMHDRERIEITVGISEFELQFDPTNTGLHQALVQDPMSNSSHGSGASGQRTSIVPGQTATASGSQNTPSVWQEPTTYSRSDVTHYGMRHGQLVTRPKIIRTHRQPLSSRVPGPGVAAASCSKSTIIASGARAATWSEGAAGVKTRTEQLTSSTHYSTRSASDTSSGYNSSGFEGSEIAGGRTPRATTSVASGGRGPVTASSEQTSTVVVRAELHRPPSSEQSHTVVSSLPARDSSEEQHRNAPSASSSVAGLGAAVATTSTDMKAGQTAVDLNTSKYRSESGVDLAQLTPSASAATSSGGETVQNDTEFDVIDLSSDPSTSGSNPSYPTQLISSAKREAPDTDTSRPFRCRNCGQKFESAAERDDHRSRAH